MLSTNLAFELDKNAIFLRNQELNLHHGKLYSIQNRKNKYIQTENKLQAVSRNKYSELQYSISKDNSYLGQKLHNISLRSNKSLLFNTQFNSFLKKKNNALIAINELNNQHQNEFIKSYRKRLQSVGSVVDNKKISRDFKVTRNVYNQLRKIQPHQSAVNIFTSYNHFRLTRCKGAKSLKKKKLPPLQINSNSKK